MKNAGGIERVVSNLLIEWSKNYNLYLIVKDDANNSFYYIPNNVKRISINSPLTLNMKNRLQRIFAVLINQARSIKALRKCLNSIDFDYIYTTTPLNSYEVHKANKNLDKKMVISEHASAYAVNRVYRYLKNKVYPKARCISVPNKSDCKVYRDMGCNTIYLPHINSFPKRKMNNCNSKIALNIGRLTPDKRQDELIRIWNSVNRNGWELWIVGSGEEKKRLETIIETYNLSDSVKLFDFTQNISKVFEKASLFLFTSRMEGFGMVLLEAMSFGIPCISYDCPSGPRDLIINGVNGYLIENNNINAFVKKLNTVLTSSSLEYLSVGAYETANSWNNEDIINKWNSIFEQ